MAKLKKLADTTYIPIDDVVVGERLRKDSPTVKNMVEDIAKSIKDIGPLQPLILDEKNNLIDGGCRYAAYKLLGAEEVPIVRRKRVTAGGKLMMEVEANLRRSDLTWLEKVEAIARYHELKTEQAEESGEEWSQRATGSLLKVSNAHVSNCVQMWPFIKKGDPDVMKCSSLQEAQDILLERKKKAAVQHALTVTAMKAPEAALQIAGTEKKRANTAPVVFQLGKGDNKVTVPTKEESFEVQSPQGLMPPKVVDLSQMLFNADCTEWMLAMPKDSVDVIVTDIPYGVDMANMEDMKGIDMMKDTHEVEGNLDLMPKFIKGAYHILRPNSYLIFFYALQHHEKLRNWGEDAGFKVQDWPLLWLKPHSCKNNAPQCNWTKSFEPVMIMKKGSPVLKTPMTKCHMEVDGMPDKKMQSNPFAKPLLFLSEMIFKPLGLAHNSICLDPFAGEGSILNAAILHGLQPIGVELDKSRFPSLVARIQRTYTKAFNTNCQFILPEYEKQEHLSID
jgi:ParB-like chromosome segregation protein Spo0J